MFQFTYNPTVNRESLRDFNARVGEFCSDNAVINIEASMLGQNLVIQGQTADEMDMDGVPTYTVMVRSVDLLSREIEEDLDAMIDSAKAKHQPDEENGEIHWPVKMLFQAKNDKTAWAILIIMNGVAEDDAGGGDGGEGGEDSPTPSPVGFQPEGAPA